MTIEDISYYINNYYIMNNKLYKTSDNLQVMDENMMLKYKTAYLIYSEARLNYQKDVQQYGKARDKFEQYIIKVMQTLSVNDEIINDETNKLINLILNSNGHYEEIINGDSLEENKYSIFIDKKIDYIVSYLKLKFRQKGLDIDSFELKHDLYEVSKNNTSKVIINFNIKSYANPTLDNILKTK